MARSQHTVHIARSPQVVWANGTDFGRGPEWMRRLVAAPVSPGPAGLGTRVTQVRRVPDRTIASTVEIVEWDPPRLRRKRSTGGALRADGRYELRPRNGGTDLTFSLEIHGAGVARLAEWLMGRTLQADTEVEAETIKQRIEESTMAGGSPA